MPDPVFLFVGDLHAGSSVAVMEPFSDHDGIRYSPSPAQAVVLKFWRQMVADVKAQTKGHALILCLGGDLVDGVAHHNSTQTVGDVNDQRALAVQLLLPLANISKMIYALLGTDAHVGQSGAEDASVAKELGAEARYRWRIESAGRVVDWAHHISMGRRPWTQEGALTSAANKLLIESWQRRQPTPALLVRHHIHRHVRVHVKGTDVFTCPGWQLATSFTRRLDPAELLACGAVLWFPKTGDIRPLLYEVPDDPITQVTFKG